jgi:hypothetical protein
MEITSGKCSICAYADPAKLTSRPEGVCMRDRISERIEYVRLGGGGSLDQIS